MRITKFKFLKILAKHISLKLNHRIPNEQDLMMMVTSLTPMFNMYSHKLMESNIMDSNGFIHIETLEKEMNDFFLMVPTINIPLGSSSLPITKEDVNKFITELFSKGDIEEVIYLPCQN